MRYLLKAISAGGVFLLFCCSLSAQYFYLPDNDISLTSLKEQGDLQLSILVPLKKKTIYN